jgi:hypothetical protein
MEANITILVDVETMPRLIGHLLSEQELRIEPLTRKVARACHMAEEGSIFEAKEMITEARQTLLSIDTRLQQCETLVKGMGNALTAPEPQEEDSKSHIIEEQARNLKDFSTFLTKMTEQEEGDGETQEG